MELAGAIPLLVFLFFLPFFHHFLGGSGFVFFFLVVFSWVFLAWFSEDSAPSDTGVGGGKSAASGGILFQNKSQNQKKILKKAQNSDFFRRPTAAGSLGSYIALRGLVPAFSLVALGAPGHKLTYSGLCAFIWVYTGLYGFIWVCMNLWGVYTGLCRHM